jgi:hypothetical protein
VESAVVEQRSGAPAVAQQGTTLLDTHFMTVARAAGHRCPDCKLIFLES